MRYEEIGEPFGEGWTYDEAGTIHTPSGYHCTPQLLECALWLFGCLSFDARRYLVRSDEAAGAFRPLYETSDADPEGKVEPTRLRLAEDGGSSGCLRASRC